MRMSTVVRQPPVEALHRLGEAQLLDFPDILLQRLVTCASVLSSNRVDLYFLPPGSSRLRNGFLV